MFPVVWASVGLIVGVTAVRCARHDIANQRQLGATFGEAHVMDMQCAVLMAGGLSAVILYLAARTTSSLLLMSLVASGLFTSLWAAFVDLDTHSIPRRIVLIGSAIGGGHVLLALILKSNDVSPRGAVVGALLAWGFMRLVEALSRGDMGHADVTLSGYLGLLLGAINVEKLPAAFFAAFLFAGLVAAVMMIFRKMNRSTFLPLGPFLVLGMLFAVLR